MTKRVAGMHLTRVFLGGLVGAVFVSVASRTMIALLAPDQVILRWSSLVLASLVGGGVCALLCGARGWPAGVICGASMGVGSALLAIPFLAARISTSTELLPLIAADVTAIVVVTVSAMLSGAATAHLLPSTDCRRGPMEA
jgi:hypothetical protein